MQESKKGWIWFSIVVASVVVTDSKFEGLMKQRW